MCYQIMTFGLSCSLLLYNLCVNKFNFFETFDFFETINFFCNNFLFYNIYLLNLFYQWKIDIDFSIIYMLELK